MALKPIYIWFARRWSDAEWQDFEAQPDYQKALDVVQLAVSDLKLGAGDGAMLAYRVLGDNTDSRLSLGLLTLPQLLFSTPIDPNDPAKGQMFLAKLVQDQITRKNVATMLQAVRALEPKQDPGQPVQFYDPTLHFPVTIGISNLADAPGSGYLIGFNPLTESLTINRYGQILENFLNGLKKALPWIAAGLIAYKISEQK